MSLFPMIRVAVVGLALGTLPAATAAWAADAPAPTGAPTGDPVVARVNGTEIHRSEVLRTIAALPAQVRQMPTEMVFPAVLDQMVNGKLVAAAAAEQKLGEDAEFKEKMKDAAERVIQ